MQPHQQTSPLIPYTTLFRSIFLLKHADESLSTDDVGPLAESVVGNVIARADRRHSGDLSAGLSIKNQEHRDFPCTNKQAVIILDRKSTRLNSSHRCISYAVY